MKKRIPALLGIGIALNIRFVGESDDSHCDRFWAKALRQHALSSNQVGIGAMVGW